MNRSRKVDLTEKRFGRLVVIRMLLRKDKNRSFYCLCKCDCGKEIEVRSRNLISGQTKSCGCYKKEVLSRKRIEYGLSAKNQVFNNYCQGAKRRNISFKLTFEQFLELSQKLCHYCNSEPGNFNKGRKENGTFKYNGIDRKDNTKGYTLENVVPCCKICGRAKMDLPYEDFMKWINEIIKYRGVHEN